jgi:hypothetical protein
VIKPCTKRPKIVNPREINEMYEQHNDLIRKSTNNAAPRAQFGDPNIFSNK